MASATRRQLIEGALTAGVALQFAHPRIGLAQGAVAARSLGGSLGGSLHLLTAEERDPNAATSYGLGLLLTAAVEAGAA